jgi:hypothetical protein
MMKEILTEALKTVEKAYENPQSVDLDKIIQQLQEAKERYGDKGTMLENTITALIQAKNAIAHMETAEDYSPTIAFGQAHNALEQAIQSYENIDENRQ